MRFFLYSIRWQLSGFILAPIIAWIHSPWEAAIIGNLIGAMVFYFPDKYIFNKSAKEVLCAMENWLLRK